MKILKKSARYFILLLCFVFSLSGCKSASNKSLEKVNNKQFDNIKGGKVMVYGGKLFLMDLL